MFCQKDNTNNITPALNKTAADQGLNTLEKRNFIPLHVGAVHMNIEDYETVPSLSGRDYTIDLKGTGTGDIFKLNSNGRIHLNVNSPYTNNDGIFLETQSSGVKISSNKDVSITSTNGNIEIDGSTSQIEIGKTTTNNISIGSYQADTTTIQSERVHITASSQNTGNPDGVILLSGIVEEQVYTGKNISLNERTGGVFSEYKIRSGNTDLMKITPVNGTGDSCVMELNGTLVNVSDGTMKKNVETLENVSEKLRSIRGVRFQYKEDTPFNSDIEHLGIIAQEVEQVFPELVVDSNNGYKTMNYVSLSAVLLQALKEQQQQIDDLKKIIEKIF